MRQDEAAVLSAAQIQEFIRNGYVVVKGCFPAEKAEEWIQAAYQRLGYKKDDPSFWKEQRVPLASSRSVLVRDFAPKAWGAICQLVGGEQAIFESEKFSWSDAFLIKFPIPEPSVWRAPSKKFGTWHKDGPHTPHFLDSAETGLLTYVLWSKLEPRGGGTFLAPESVAHVARHLAAHPEGVDKTVFSNFVDRKCRRFVELTGEPGDVILVHPYMLHSESDNASERPRFFTVRIVELKRPMKFTKAGGKASVVEHAVLRALGVKSFPFRRLT
jgi:hypothetical protein